MKKYAQENIKFARRFYEAASRNEFDFVRKALDANVEWIEPSRPGLWFSGTHRGAEAVWKEVISPIAEKFDNFRINMKRFYGVGDHVIGIGYFRGHAKVTGKELDAVTAHVITVRNGKIVRFEAFHDRDSWVEALGLVHR